MRKPSQLSPGSDQTARNLSRRQRTSVTQKLIRTQDKDALSSDVARSYGRRAEASLNPPPLEVSKRGVRLFSSAHSLFSVAAVHQQFLFFAPHGARSGRRRRRRAHPSVPRASVAPRRPPTPHDLSLRYSAALRANFSVSDSRHSKKYRERSVPVKKRGQQFRRLLVAFPDPGGVTRANAVAKDLGFKVNVNVKSFPSHKAHRAALISVSLALSQTPVYTARPRIRG